MKENVILSLNLRFTKHIKLQYLYEKYNKQPLFCIFMEVMVYSGQPIFLLEVLTMQVRPMTAADKEITIPMVLKFYDGPAVEHTVPMQTIEKVFADAVGKNPHLEGFILEQDNQVVGFAYLTFFYACEVSGKVIMIEELFIKEQYRGRGYGQQFMDWLYAAYPDVVRFRLEITPENRAVNLYRRNGFVELTYGQMVYDR